jgi:hypothetical protein
MGGCDGARDGGNGGTTPATEGEGADSMRLTVAAIAPTDDGARAMAAGARDAAAGGAEANPAVTSSVGAATALLAADTASLFAAIA